jgi:hypothetical protein
MKGIIILSFNLLACLFSFSQEGVFYIKTDNLPTNYPSVVRDTSNHELHFYLLKDKTKEVGIYLTNYELGFWNSKIDTFALNDSLLVVFINPFPDVVLRKSVPDPSVKDKMQPVGIGPFIYEKSPDGKYMSKCIYRDENGTMKFYFYDDVSVSMIEYYSQGELIKTDYFDLNTHFMSINK